MIVHCHDKRSFGAGVCLCAMGDERRSEHRRHRELCLSTAANAARKRLAQRQGKEVSPEHFRMLKNRRRRMQAREQERQIIHPWVAEGHQNIRIGVSFMGSCTDWKQSVRWVQTAEELGFDSYWLPDHPALLSDCWALLSALAVTTSRIRLGTLVDCVFYRNPVVLARTAADVDRLSGGRLILGLGMGDLPFEFGQMGIPFLSTRKRQEALEETIQIVRGLWGSSPFTFQGKYMQIDQCFLSVGPVQQPYVPLLIAGGGEKVTLRQVAHYADASNFGPHPDTGGASSTEDVVRKCDVLRAHCAAAGRPEDAVLRTHVTLPLVMGETRAALAVKQDAVPAYLRNPFLSSEMAFHPSDAIAYYRTLVQAGIQYFIMILWQNDLETLHMLAQQVLPALRAGI